MILLTQYVLSGFSKADGMFPNSPVITCGVHSVATKSQRIRILHFKQFYKHFVFDNNEEGYVKKIQKTYMDVRVILQRV